jgi:hypothetical protein
MLACFEGRDGAEKKLPLWGDRNLIRQGMLLTRGIDCARDQTQRVVLESSLRQSVSDVTSTLIPRWDPGVGPSGSILTVPCH